MTLYFGTYDDRRVISNPSTIEEVNKDINKFLEEHNYKSYYTIISDEGNGVIRYDVGSWSQFFWLDTNEVEE